MNKKELEEHRRLLLELCKDYKQRIDKAIEYIKNNIDNTGWLEIGSNCVKKLLEILGDKENEEE